MPHPRIAVVGSANTDMVIKADRIPAPGETVIGREFVMAPGGKGANQAVAAARLGAEVTFVARLGSDVFGDRAIAGYEQEGIDTTWIVRDSETASGVALIFVDEAGENSIAVASGANARLTPEDVERAREVIASAHVLLVQLEVPLAALSRAIELAHSAGVRVILNPAPAREVPASLLSRVSIATPNEHEIKVVVGESDRARSVAKMLDAGTQTVLVTLGAQGVLWAEKGQQVRVPAFRVQAVDTTAAGDAFNGALAYALASELAMQEAIRYASAAAAIAVTRMGAQPSLATRTEVEAFLRQAGS
ncbi:MAG TPA: ribokinase [Anaerolineae bacterium]|nr:ribokinase [Anaerolineae bacterium]